MTLAVRSGFRLSVLVVFVLLVPIGAVSAHAVSVPTSTPAGTGGPIFVDLGNWFADTTLITEPIEVHGTLQLFVDVWDQEAVDLVLGCFKRTNETQWSNVTMTLLGYSQLDSHLHYFGANATEFTLSPSDSLAVWNVKYYAHDSVGRWNVSDVVNASICALYDLGPPDTTPVLTGAPHLILAAITVFVMLAAIRWIVRRERV